MVENYTFFFFKGEKVYCKREKGRRTSTAGVY